MRILGIDPGTATTGFGIIDFINNEYRLLDYGCIKTLPGQSLSTRLSQIAQDLDTIISKWKPDEAAVEELFFSKNVKTAIHVAHARGVILQQLSASGFEPAEYTPGQIKEAVCGYGRAEKMQVQKMMQLILQMDYIPSPDDAADALAIAVCHANNIKTRNLLLAS